MGAIIALLTGVAGWFYLFYSRGGDNLSSMECKALSRRRVFFRRVGGSVMVVLAVSFVVLFYYCRPEEDPGAFLLLLTAVFGLLLTILVLGLIDLRLTWKIRRGMKKRDVP